MAGWAALDLTERFQDFDSEFKYAERERNALDNLLTSRRLAVAVCDRGSRTLLASARSLALAS